MVSDISGVILAGGENRRFGGRSKSDMIVGGKSIFSLMTGILMEIFEEIIIVTNDPEKIKDAGRFKITGDIHINKGPAGGVHAAMTVSSKKAVFVFAGDMPFLDKRLIIRQAELFSGGKSDALAPVIEKFIEPLHSIYRISLINKLDKYLTGSENTSMQGFISKIDIDFLEIQPWEEEARSLTNINTPSALTALNKKITAGI